MAGYGDVKATKVKKIVRGMEKQHKPKGWVKPMPVAMRTMKKMGQRGK